MFGVAVVLSCQNAQISALIPRLAHATCVCNDRPAGGSAEFRGWKCSSGPSMKQTHTSLSHNTVNSRSTLSAQYRVLECVHFSCLSLYSVLNLWFMLEPCVFIIIPIQCEESVLFHANIIMLRKCKTKNVKKITYIFFLFSHLDTRSNVNIGQIFLHNTKTIKDFQPEGEFYFKTHSGHIWLKPIPNKAPKVWTFFLLLHNNLAKMQIIVCFRGLFTISFVVTFKKLQYQDERAGLDRTSLSDMAHSREHNSLTGLKNSYPWSTSVTKHCVMLVVRLSTQIWEKKK